MDLRSPSIKELMLAIKNVQQNAGSIAKTTKGQVGTRTYNYANLNDTWETIKDLLNNNHLVVVQSPVTAENNVGGYFETMIYHTESEQYVIKRMQMVLQREDPQAIGSAITYYRRYMLTSMLGLIPDDDNDAREHRLATAEQKGRLVGAIKDVYPEIDRGKITEAIQNITGKHPSNIREDEADRYTDLIKAYK
jgi:hypothetical protein